jgi:AcrR family transcriptional regulator
MPRAFSEQEKDAIRAALLEQGRAFLATYGIRKTSVENLTDGVGISKGAFYLFFPSKEELFFTIFEQFEADYQEQLLRLAARPAPSPRLRLREFFRHAFGLWRSSPLFRHFGPDDYNLLLRRLPPERVAAALDSDERFAARLLALWQADGLNLHMEPAAFTALSRSLFFVSMHADEIGPHYQGTIDLLCDGVAMRLVEGLSNER